MLTALVIVILGLALLVGLLPTIIAHTPLMAYFIRRAAMLEGTITFRSASIGWFSPASVSGIEIRDAQNETVLEADSLTCDRSLCEVSPQFLERRHAADRKAAAQREVDPRRQQRGVGARPLADRPEQLVEPGR